jgi:hypothetical protein
MLPVLAGEVGLAGVALRDLASFAVLVAVEPVRIRPVDSEFGSIGGIRSIPRAVKRSTDNAITPRPTLAQSMVHRAPSGGGIGPPPPGRWYSPHRYEVPESSEKGSGPRVRTQRDPSEVRAVSRYPPTYDN